MKRILPASLALAVVLGGTAFAASTTTWTGTTNKQNQPITVTLDRTGMVSASYNANYVCFTGRHRAGVANGVPTSLGSAKFGRGGKIDHHFNLLRNTDHIHFVAQVVRNRRGKRHLVGYFNETYTSQARHTCRSGKVTFSLPKA